MQRAPGWVRLAGIALEVTALAFIAHVIMEDPQPRVAAGTRSDDLPDAPAPHADDAVAAPSVETPAPGPMDFLREAADEGARYYRAADTGVEMFAGFYTDGRVRLAGAQHRFAGMLEGGRADVLQLDTNEWSELFVHTTPSGTMQLELRGGPYDAHVLTCEKLD